MPSNRPVDCSAEHSSGALEPIAFVSRITLEMHRLARVLIFAIAIYLLLCAGAAFFLADVTVHPNRRPLTSDERSEVIGTAANLNAHLTEVAIEGEDHALLR